MGFKEDFWPSLETRPDPSLRTHLIHQLLSLGVSEPVQPFLERLIAKPPLNPTARQALWLGIGLRRVEPKSKQPEIEKQRQETQKRILRQAQSAFRDDPDPGVHAAARWLLLRELQTDFIHDAEDEFAQAGIAVGRDWFVNSHKQSFAILKGGTFTMGRHSQNRADERVSAKHLVTIDRPFAIGMTKVTIEQFQRFLAANPDAAARMPNVSLSLVSGEAPQVGVSWEMANAYCRWLSAQEGLPPDQSYRLPTEAEWEFAVRAGSEAPRYFGVLDSEQDQIIGSFEHHRIKDIKDLPSPFLNMPNAYGLFGTLTGAREWCHDLFRPYCRGQCDRPAPDAGLDDPAGGPGERVWRGAGVGDRLNFMVSSLRHSSEPQTDTSMHGFRIARTIPRR